MKQRIFFIYITIITILIASILALGIFTLFTPFSLGTIQNRSFVYSQVFACLRKSDRAECLWDGRITPEYKSSFASQTDFNSYIQENFGYCFKHMNPLIDQFTQPVLYSAAEGSEILDFTMSDDLCMGMKLDLNYQDGMWKISRIER